jgi:glycosyltransferase involved in cell wall biosynthesis
MAAGANLSPPNDRNTGRGSPRPQTRSDLKFGAQSGTQRPSPSAERPLDLAVVILTYNEERHIQRAIASVAGVARDVVVVDSFSTDRTVELALALGARVLQHEFETQATQMEWALSHADVDAAWVMRLDADEIVEPDLAYELRERVPNLPAEVTGLVLNRKHIFMGRWIRHGGRYPMYLLRIWRRGCAVVEQRLMDEHMVLTRGASVRLRGGFADFNLQDLTFFTAKHNVYATREALEVLKERFQLSESPTADGLAIVPRQTRRRRVLKSRLYDRLGLAGPLAYFLFRYLAQLGFLDGREGLLYHVLQGFWYRFLVAAKVLELERAVVGLTDRDEIVIELTRLTGFNPLKKAG